MANYCVLYSTRDQDLALAEKIAKANSLELFQVTNPQILQEFLVNTIPVAVLWDVDIKDPRDKLEKDAFMKTGQILADHHIPADRIFGIKDKTEDISLFSFNNPSYGNLLLRNLDDPAADIFTKLIQCSMMPDPFGTEKYLPEGTNIQTITIKNSEHRFAATEAVNNVMVKRGNNTRIASSIAKAVDEMLMNAIFDAPQDDKGVYYRNNIARTNNFLLKEKEEVTLRVGATDSYGIATVVDKFGSLDKKKIMNRLSKDYQKMEYEVNEKAAGAGVGIYGILHSGLSLLFISKPGVKTEAHLFFPVVKNIKALRNSFRFVGFFFPQKR